jgi:hypothetical protein
MQRHVCQNIDIRLTRREDSATEAASHFQGFDDQVMERGWFY